MSVVTVGSSLRTRWLSWRWVLLVALVIALAALITALSAPHSAHRLGPDNPAPNGARALVSVLRQQGVDVQERRDSRQAVAATTGRSTLVVTSPGLLGPAQLRRLADDDAADLVLVEPDDRVLSALAPDIHAAGTAGASSVTAGCSAPAAERAGSARAGGLLYSLADEPAVGVAGAAVCYPDGADRGSYVIELQSSRVVIVIGQSDVLTNEYLGQDGNAALALNSLGIQPSLIWYTPDPLEPSGETQPATLTDLLPDWVFWVILQLAVVAGVAMIWRSRRLGRLVPEPLPVVVRAAETQEGRARLYRQASARGRAGATLRTTTLRRLAVRLAAPAGTTPEQLVALVAGTTGRDETGLHTLLLGPEPASDAALIALADDLDAVEHDLTRTIDPKGSLL
jgi:hypothetical protein